MSIETELFAALGPLVANRAQPSTFEQPGGGLPVWPAVRYSIISSVPIEDLCGDGDDTTADVRVQIDAVATTYKGMRTLRLAVMAAMRLLPTPARLSIDFDEFDAETKTHRSVMEFSVSGSSPP